MVKYARLSVDMSIESQDQKGNNGSPLLRGLGTVLIFGTGGAYMLFSKSSPKYELYTLVYDEDNFVKFTMSNVDAICLAVLTVGVLAVWAGKARGT